jgi:hypothetical protein
MTYIKFKGNSKLDKSGIGHFSLPAILTCPNAGTCKQGCYATQGRYLFPNVRDAYARNLKLSKNIPALIKTLSQELTGYSGRIRIHTSGDFYSRKYLQAWLEIIRAHPNVQFYAYTKMVSLLKSVELPSNFTVIFSEGGKEDSLIGETDRHARVFDSKDSLLAAGYTDASQDDLLALGPEKKIGLVYHGAKAKKWNTGGAA